MSTMKKILIGLLVAAVMVGGLSFAPQPAQAASCARYYTVRWGDTLYGIGLYYGVSWTKLADWNNIARPGRIYAGQRLCVAMGSGTGGAGDGTGGPYYSGIPTFSIASVTRNGTVTIRTRNLPPNDTFQVLMGHYGSRAINGFYVTSINTGAGGSQTFTFNVPAQLYDSYRIAIRLQSPTSGYFSFNWFYNNTAY